MNLRGAKPVVDYKIKKFIYNLDAVRDLYNAQIQSNFVDNFYSWISSSKLNSLVGLDQFTNRKLVAGTAQAFDHFYWRHKNRRFRFFKGEFMYHSAVLKHGGNWAYIEDDVILSNDCVIISIPFSDRGGIHYDMETVLHYCTGMNIPVLLDFAYYPCTKNINLNLNDYPTVETITFSISKAFYGCEFLRVGLRLEKEDTDDGVDVFNSVEMINRVSLSIANSLIQEYPVDHNWMTYNTEYYQVCKEQNLEPTNCIMFGLGGEEYADYNRGGNVNRVCISELIGEKINGSS